MGMGTAAPELPLTVRWQEKGVPVQQHLDHQGAVEWLVAWTALVMAIVKRTGIQCIDRVVPALS